MLQEPRRLMVCYNYSGVCGWECLPWRSQHLACVKLRGKLHPFFSLLFFLVIQRIATGGYLPGSQPEPGVVLLSSRFPHAVCAFALPSP